jgi:hypothetical protein
MSASPAAVPLPVWRRNVVDPSALRISAQLQDRLDSGAPIELVGRFSGSDGPEARRLAVDDVFGAAKVLRQHSGIDLSASLPPRETLIHKLETARVHTSRTLEGKPFRNRYAVLDLRERGGLVVLLSNGSGHLLDEDGNQPFVVEAARMMRKYQAALYACKRFDRTAREDWGAAPIMIALRQLDAFICDEDGLGGLDFGRSVTSFVKGGGSRHQADHLPVQSRTGQKNRSGSEVIDGRVAYHIATAPPPGCGVVWLKGAGTTPTDRILYLDTPGGRPTASQVASGLPQVFNDRGEPVDQVANVRFILAKYGRQDWPTGRLVAELGQRRFSTEGMRAHNRNVSATIRTDGAGKSSLATVVGHLDDYERGELHVRVGAAEEPHVIKGFQPPDGRPWAAPEDFQRIREYLRRRDERLAKATRLTFSGLRVRLNGQPVHMLVGKRPRGSSTARSYRFVKQDGYPHQAVNAAPRVLLPPTAWAQSIVDGLAAVDGRALLPAELVDRDDGPDDGQARWRGELATIETQIAAAEAQLGILMGQVKEIHADGSRVLTGAMLGRVQDDYNEIAENQLPDLRHARDELVLRIEESEARRPPGADPSSVLSLVDSLRDPEDRRFRPLWLTCIRNVEFTSKPAPSPEMSGFLLTWTGALELATEDLASVLVPFSGSYDTRRRRGHPRTQDARSNVDRCLDAMRRGVPFHEIDVPHRAHLLPAVRSRLGGSADRNLPLLTCDDPFLVRVATECLLRAHEPDPQVAAELDVPVRLVERIRTVQSEGGRGWLLEGDAAEVALYVLAAEHAGSARAEEAVRLAGASLGQVYNVASRLRRDTRLWTTRRKLGYLLTPCRCGSLARAPMRLREVDGPVCLACRHDTAGIVWPADPYDAYRAHPSLWSGTRWQIEQPPHE